MDRSYTVKIGGGGGEGGSGVRGGGEGGLGKALEIFRRIVQYLPRAVKLKVYIYVLCSTEY